MEMWEPGDSCRVRIQKRKTLIINWGRPRQRCHTCRMLPTNTYLVRSCRASTDSEEAGQTEKLHDAKVGLLIAAFRGST